MVTLAIILLQRAEAGKEACVFFRQGLDLAVMINPLPRARALLAKTPW